MGVFAYFVLLHLTARWVGMYSQKNLERETFDFESAGMRLFMEQRQVPYTIQMSVRRQMEQEFEFRQKRVMESARFDVLRRLAPAVRSQLYGALNRSVLVRHPFFEKFSYWPLLRMCELAET